MKCNSTCSKAFAVILIVILILPVSCFSQFLPIPISGFNNEVVAEAGTSSLTTTTVSLDGVTVSNKVIYTQTFRTLNSFGGGGIPDNGTISRGADSYQLAPYTSNNALLIQRNQNGDININSPAKYNTIRVLCFSTEGSSLVNAILFFADATPYVAIPNCDTLAIDLYQYAGEDHLTKVSSKSGTGKSVTEH